jgi:hypothetical protein
VPPVAPAAPLAAVPPLAPAAPLAAVPPLAPAAPLAAVPPLAPAAPLAAVVPPAPAAAAAAAPAARPNWPCPSCGEQVSFDEMTCPRCQTPFLGGVNPDVSLKLPVVGDVVAMSPGARFAFMAGGAAVLATVLVLLFLVLGHIL